MKKLIWILWAVVLFSTVDLCAQTVKGIPYQTVVRDAEGNPMSDQEVTVRFYIQRTLSSRADAEPLLLYSETHTTVSDANGLVTLQVGEGEPLEGSFDAVDWWGKISVKIELELTGSGEALFTTTQELASVPYALSAENALLIKSEDGTQWSIECDNDGTLKTTKRPQRYTKLVFSDEFDGSGLPDDSKWGYEEGYVRAIGVSNFLPHHLEKLLSFRVTPMVNQLEVHPGYSQRALVTLCQEHGIVVEGWSPFGRGAVLKDATINAIADAHECTAAQVCLAFCRQLKVIPLPKSSASNRMVSNLDFLDITLSTAEMGQLLALDDIKLGYSREHPDR